MSADILELDEKKAPTVPVTKMSVEETLPPDWQDGLFVGRVWRPDVKGPSVVKLDSDGYLVDITATFPTMSELCNTEDAATAVREATGERIGRLQDILANTPSRGNGGPFLLPPPDLAAIRAAGVTFPISTYERVIEEKAQGDVDKAAKIRAEINAARESGEIPDLATIVPGSPEAKEAKKLLQSKGWWSQYFEVAIGKDGEIFTKAQPTSAVGHGSQAGLHPESNWNNPEPEVAIVLNSRGEVVGATLFNDVNLRDFEGRSGLLLGEAKDQRASAATGPFIRLFDGNSFTMNHVREMELKVHVEGVDDGFTLDGSSSMNKIRRDPERDLARQLFAQHDYPDGALLSCGTLFAPIQDRGEPGKGFTHHIGDVTSISSGKLGTLTNVMVSTEDAPRWEMGTGALMRNLAERGVFDGQAQEADASRTGRMPRRGFGRR